MCLYAGEVPTSFEKHFCISSQIVAIHPKNLVEWGRINNIAVQ
jgi:hypothetical protein